MREMVPQIPTVGVAHPLDVKCSSCGNGGVVQGGVREGGGGLLIPCTLATSSCMTRNVLQYSPHRDLSYSQL